jgi:hypothetical protein
MQQISETRQANYAKLGKLNEERAMQRLAKHPQTALPSPGPSVEIAARKVRGGGMAGLSRVIGAGKKEKHMVEDMDADDMMELEGGARHQGKALMKHLAAMHGGAYSKEFLEGMMDDKIDEHVDELHKPKRAKKVRGGAGMFAASAAPENAPSAMRVPASGATIAPGAEAPKSAGAPAFAPASFKRNTVGMGKPAMKGGAKAHLMPTEMAAVKGGRRAERGQMIAQLMREHKMSLGEASRYLKENPM